jgi:hypothetical protein
VKKLALTPDQYEKIETSIGLKDTEDYAVVTHRIRGKYERSIHVFARLPNTKELAEYESRASKLKFRGNKAEVEGSQLVAARDLYNLLIVRAYDVPVGTRTIIGKTDPDGTVHPISRDDAKAQVPPMVKREAIRDFVAGHWSQGQISDMVEEDDEQVVKDKDDEED